MDRVTKSFIRKLLAVTNNPEIISFAGGLPNPQLFPVDAFKKASQTVLEKHGAQALQYSTTEGYLPLRQYICDQYLKKEEFIVNPDEILITNGSQQGLDLVSKVMINPGDNVLLENPTYLAALQTLSMYGAEFTACTLTEQGPDIAEIAQILQEKQIKLFYGIPNFQNPSGITWNNKIRKEIATLLNNSNTLFIEDDPYGEIRWNNKRQETMGKLLQNVVLLGSFSKTVAPGLRLGWIYTKDKALYEKLYVAKQAADLHTSSFNQQVLYEYLSQNVNNKHVTTIAKAYGAQKDIMTHAIDELLPNVTYTQPDGGMFLWLTFDKEVDTFKLFDIAIKHNVAFVPGIVFYIDQENAPKNTARFNFTNASEENIVEGMKRIAKALEEYTA